LALIWLVGFGWIEFRFGWLVGWLDLVSWLVWLVEFGWVNLNLVGWVS
jgi:hypothetical protein